MHERRVWCDENVGVRVSVMMFERDSNVNVVLYSDGEFYYNTAYS